MSHWTKLRAIASGSGRGLKREFLLRTDRSRLLLVRIGILYNVGFDFELVLVVVVRQSRDWIASAR